MEIPTAFRLLVLYLIWMAWFMFLDFEQKMRGFIAASVFAVIEFVYTSLTHPKGYTTFAQFWVAMLYWPIMIGPYR